MRKVIPQSERIMYKDENDISLSVQISKGQLVSKDINNAEISTMVDGESRIDFADNTEKIKVNGRLYKRVVVDSEIKLQEIK